MFCIQKWSERNKRWKVVRIPVLTIQYFWAGVPRVCEFQKNCFILYCLIGSGEYAIREYIENMVRGRKFLLEISSLLYNYFLKYFII